MSLLDRLFGGARNKAYGEGVALLEAERYAEAVERLREASLGRSDHPSGSLASFQYRQALVACGRELLRSGDPAAARPYFGEAVEHWDQYPDLHCLHGSASALAGDWEAGLAGARDALRRNPDYVEARLLESLCLQNLGRPREAAASLNDLVETGRRVEHWLIDNLAEGGPFDEHDLPEDLAKSLATAVGGKSEKEVVASAVAQCRAGRWEEGLERFADLVRKRPRYPDYRTRHAAALFHLGRNDEALAEVEAALALNETYRTAIDLKGLVLADLGRVGEAGSFLADCDTRLDDDRPGTPHEDLFGAYLRGVLALLSGRPEQVEGYLGDWRELSKNFARAEVLLAAADDLRDRPDGCGRRLAALAAEWPSEHLYFYLMACHHLRRRHFEDASGVLGRWPAKPAAEPDLRPLYLEGLVALGRGQEIDPEAWPSDLAEDTALLDPTGCPRPGPMAWRFLKTRAAFLAGEDEACWRECGDLVAEGAVTERVVKLQVLAAAEGGAEEGWMPTPVLPDSSLPGLVALDVAAGRDASVASRRQLRIHPEDLTALWLSPAFWLDPVRGWIA